MDTDFTTSGQCFSGAFVATLLSHRVPMQCSLLAYYSTLTIPLTMKQTWSSNQGVTCAPAGYGTNFMQRGSGYPRSLEMSQRGDPMEPVRLSVSMAEQQFVRPSVIAESLPHLSSVVPIGRFMLVSALCSRDGGAGN